MKNSMFIFKSIFLFVLALFVFYLKPQTTFALTSGDYTYTLDGDNAIITNYSGVGGDVIIPDTIDGHKVMSIAKFALSYSSITSISIPDGVTSIYYNDFHYCTKLTAINVSDKNTAYSSVDGVLYDKSQTTLIRYPIAKIGASFTIASTITSISDSAFEGCVNLSSITIGSNVTSIGDSAFVGTKLTSVIIPDSIDSIGNNMFSGCTSLVSISIPNSVTSIGSYAFSRCTSLLSITIPDSVVKIDNYAFDGCSALKSIKISENAISIGERAFNDCISLTSVTIPDSVYDVDNYAFDGCKSLTSVYFGKNVMNVGDYAFNYCTKLTSIINSDNIKNIGEYAFCGCSSLENNINLKSVQNIGEYAFLFCKSIISINFGSNLTSISDYAFEDCTSLTTINVSSDNIKYSSYNGILYDKLMTTLVYYPVAKTDFSFTVPDSVTSIGDYTFNDNANLTTINVNAKNTAYCSIDGILYDKSKETLIFCPRGRKSPSVIIPNSVININQFAFASCNKITNVVIGKNVSNIGNWAFYNTNISKLTFLGNSPIIGHSVFMRVSNLIIYYIYGNNGFTNRWNGYLTVPLYTLMYNGNGNTTGVAPINSNIYPKNSQVTVAGNTGLLTKTNYIFEGWNTKADGSGIDYTSGSTFVIGIEPAILYAKWKLNVFKYGDVNGDGNVNVVDYLLVGKYTKGVITKFPSSNGLKAADVNGDGTVNNDDYVLIRKYIITLITKFPVQ